MFYMAYATGTTDSVDYDIFPDLKAGSHLASIANKVHPFAVVSLQLEVNIETAVQINGNTEIPLQVVRVSGNDTFYGVNISLHDKMRMKSIKLADTGATWYATFQYL